MLKDGHIHSPYCPHGTKDSFKEYVEKAITLGFKEISFTEHAPLPSGFIDTTPTQDSGMQMDELQSYFHDISIIQNEYHRHIKINCGLEVDYIEGYEVEIKDFLTSFGPQLDDAILSVHFLKHDNGYDCMDYSPEVFGQMVTIYGSIDALYKKYYDTLLKSVNADLGPFKPKRIGHITLAQKFKKRFPTESRFELEVDNLLLAIKEKGYQLDYNGAGCAKPLCREPYPPLWIIKKAIALDIPLVYGSDAHQVKELAQGIDQMEIIKTS
ncbi:histidinol-phosphatase HisJ [Neobacillus sp. LXY-4]|uniref:histidinol-phosphatase HisJ n=1 Tax=Neobacillus sp. LXY-4 TaxID=3379826 RepID=UPI003EDFC877